jgi:hypothetical protein
MSAPVARLTVNYKPLSNAIRAYAKHRRMTNAQVVEVTAKKLLFDLYRAYRTVAATAAKIVEEARRRNWFTRIKKFRGGNSPYVGKTIRGPRTVVQDELDARGRKVGFLASTFLFKRWRVKKGGQRGLYAKAGAKSRVFVDTDRPNPQVVISSEVDGVIKMNSKFGLWARAIAARVADMMVYVRRKERESANVWKAFKR